MISSQVLHSYMLSTRGFNFVIDEALVPFLKKSNFVIDEASLPLFRYRPHSLGICRYCGGSGKYLNSFSEDLKCVYCGGSGLVKKCECGSGIMIGSNEFRCVKCDFLSRMTWKKKIFTHEKIVPFTYL